MMISYLRALKQYSRLGFHTFLCFGLGSILANIIGMEITPFFVWGMFSKPEKPTETYQVTRIFLDEKELNYTSWNTNLFQRYYMTNPRAYALNGITAYGGKDPNRTFLEQKLDKSSLLAPYLAQITNDSIDFVAFEVWQKRYFSGAYGCSVMHVQVCTDTISFVHQKDQVELIKHGSTCK
jgi:hypothetical protein